jgi:hypothetical protein
VTAAVELARGSLAVSPPASVLAKALEKSCSNDRVSVSVTRTTRDEHDAEDDREPGQRRQPQLASRLLRLP